MQAKTVAMNLNILDTPLDPASPTQKKVLFHHKDGKDFYKVWLYLDGPDVPFVKKVRYELHPTFAQRIHEVTRSAANPTCALVIYTWGIFTVKATVTAKTGEQILLNHKMSYDKWFSKGGVTFERDG
jgi:transcription initiation factor IIF auxiliary subunit